VDNGVTVRLFEEIDDRNSSNSQRQSQDRVAESTQGKEGDNKVEVRRC
jgi:hypothetical protein